MVHAPSASGHIVRLGTGGRIVIPAEMRARAGWRPDEPLRLRYKDGEVRIDSITDGVRRAQALFRKYDKGSGSLVESLLADRRAANARDGAETAEWLSDRTKRS